MGATNLPDRLLASLGQAGPPEIQLQSALDVKNGGVLFAIPSLIATGLLRHTKGVEISHQQPETHSSDGPQGSFFLNALPL